MAGERSFAAKDETLARFESVLDRTMEPKGTATLDKQLSDATDQMLEHH